MRLEPENQQRKYSPVIQMETEDAVGQKPDEWMLRTPNWGTTVPGGNILMKWNLQYRFVVRYVC